MFGNFKMCFVPHTDEHWVKDISKPSFDLAYNELTTFETILTKKQINEQYF